MYLGNADINGHIGDTNNPHQVTAAQLGLKIPQVDTVQTTDATSTTLATIAIQTDEEKIIDVKVHGHEDATGDHLWKRMTIGVKNVGGTAVFVGGIDTATGYDTGATNWSITASVSAGNVVISVTGEAAKTINWRSTTEID